MHVQTLVNWWSDYPEDVLTQRVLQPLQKYLTTELVVIKQLTVSVMYTIKVRWRFVLRVDTVNGYHLTEAKLETLMC